MKKFLFFIPLFVIVLALFVFYLITPSFMYFIKASDSNISKDSNHKTAATALSDDNTITANIPAPTPQNKSTSSQRLTFSFMGDILLDGHVADLIEKKGAEYVFSDVRQTLSQSDLAVANLENPISMRGTKEKDKQYTFRVKPQNAEALAYGGINLVTLANNHILDFGADALLDTITYLKSNNIFYAGAGENADAANSPVYIEKKGVRIAFLGSSHIIPFMSWHAGVNKPGVASAYNPARLLSEIQKAKTNADIVAVYIHWGEEMNTKPLSYQKNLARMYIDKGADIVIGSHPHVLQGLEFYKGKIIAYSMGNFVFTNTKKDTMILNAELLDKKLSKVRVIPCEIDNFRPILIKDAQKSEKLFSELEKISFGVSIDKQGIVVYKQ